MAQMHCLEFVTQQPGTGPNPLVVRLETRKIRITAYARPGAPAPPYVLAPNTRISQLGAFVGLDCQHKLDIRLLRFRAQRVAVKLVTFAPAARVQAYSGTAPVGTAQTMDPAHGVPQLLLVGAAGISRVEIIAPADETLLLELCVLVRR